MSGSKRHDYTRIKGNDDEVEIYMKKEAHNADYLQSLHKSAQLRRFQLT